MSMPYSAEVQAALLAFKQSEDKLITEPLHALLQNIADSGRSNYKWEDIKPLIRFKFEEGLNSRHTENNDLRTGQVFEEYKAQLLKSLESFDDFPFTLQRLCEILLGINAPYQSLRKFSFAMEKSLEVSLTVSAGDYEANPSDPFQATEPMKIDAGDSAPAPMDVTVGPATPAAGEEPMEVDSAATPTAS